MVERTDDTGRVVTMPAAPSRIVALHEPLIAVPLVALGQNVVGAYGRAADGGTLLAVDFLKNVLGADGKSLGMTGIGAVGDIDLEKVRALKPDLIVGTELQTRFLKMLEPIAPVYLQKTVTLGASGFSVEEELAHVLNRDQDFDRRKAEYLRRIASIRERHGINPTGQAYLAVVVFDQVNAVRDMSGAIQAIRDLGYEELDWPGKGAEENRQFGAPLSSESFGRLDPDFLVVMSSYVGNGHDEAAIFERLDANVPGWRRFMRAAREGNVLALDSRQMVTPTIASANHFLDVYEEWLSSHDRQ